MSSIQQMVPLNKVTVKIKTYDQQVLANWYTQIYNALTDAGDSKPYQTSFKFGSVQVDDVSVIQMQTYPESTYSGQPVPYILEVEFQELWLNGASSAVAKKQLSGQDLLDLIRP